MNKVSTLVEIIKYIEQHESIHTIVFIAQNFHLHTTLLKYLNKLYPNKSIKIIDISVVNLNSCIKEWKTTNTDKLLLCNDHDMPTDKVVNKLSKLFPLFIYSPIQVNNVKK